MRRFGWGRAVGLCLLGLVLALRAEDPAAVRSLRDAAFDQYQRIKPRPYTPLPVLIVDIDDRSLAEIGQWPWPRTVFAELADVIRAGGARATAFDALFSEPDRLNPPDLALAYPALPPAVRRALEDLPSNDSVFGAAIAQGGIVLGQAAERQAPGPASGGSPASLPPVAHATIGTDPTGFVTAFPSLIRNLPELEAGAAGLGILSARPDPDGVYRRLPVVMSVQGQLRLGLTAELLRVATGADAFAVRSTPAGVEAVVIARQPIRVAGDGTLPVYLSPSRPERFVPATDVLSGAVPPERFRGQLVLVGTSAVGLDDFRATPIGVPMAGVEIHAQALENILSGSALVRPASAPGYELVAVLVLGLFAILLVPVLGPLPTLGLSVVLLGGYLGLSFHLFDSRRILLDPTFPSMAAGLLILQMAGANYLREARQKRQIRSAFRQYVSPDLVAQLAQSPDRLVLGGETRELTLLFSDVRGFTALSEGYRDDPAGLTRLMNRFLTVLSGAILAERGTIDKFMGDAVMAFWNAPLDHDDHPAAGCRAALAMIRAVDALNARRRAEATNPEAMIPLNVGVGLNTGTCVVGNMGSDRRFDYTALGDTVNLASRLEGQSKSYGVPIVLGEATARRVQDRLAVVELDLIRVKGKTEPARVFALLGDDKLRASPAFADLEGAILATLAAYRARDWSGAEQALDRLAARAAAAGISLSGPIGLYRERIAACRAAPPPDGWDGVFTAVSK